MRIAVLLGICLISLTLSSQVPNFAFDSARWVVYGTLPYETRTVYSTGNDTLISGRTYTTIWTDYYDNSFVDSNNLELFIRPDTSNKVWFRFPSTVSADTSEYILYDFSLQVGDTFFSQGSLFLDIDTLVVFSVSTSQLDDQSLINTFQFNGNLSAGCVAFEFSEMIGGFQHPFYPLLGFSTFPDTCIPHVVCYQVNNVFLAGNSSACDVQLGFTVPMDPICHPQLVHQNEASANFNLTCFEGNPVSISCYDVLGREIFASTFSDGMAEIPISKTNFTYVRFTWESGFYFTTIISP